MTLRTQRYELTGQCQGIGFRPSLARLAKRHQLAGWVKNTVHSVELLLQGNDQQLSDFASDLQQMLNQYDDVHITDITELDHTKLTGFDILDSAPNHPGEIFITVDRAICPDCIKELNDGTNRRHGYPFLSCTACGPRFSILEKMPQDRSNTSLHKFILCEKCQIEYHDINDRRYHFQGIGCEACGPTLRYSDSHQAISGNAASLQAAVDTLRRGEILAIKAQGSYQLLCLASAAASIARLRQKKNRPHKPFAVMLDIEQQNQVALTAEDTALIRSAASPIVLAARSDSSTLPMSIAPGLHTLGVMRPTTALHHLLLRELQQPLVVTSANITDNPSCIDSTDVEQQFGNIADGFLHHDLSILHRVDDSVYQSIDQQPRPIRLGRGSSPGYLSLEHCVSTPTLALGAHQKNNFALANRHHIILSQHIGDLDSYATIEALHQSIDELARLHDIQFKKIIVDAHPRYGYQTLLQHFSLPQQKVFHHHAHASAIAGEFHHEKNWLIFSWDGLGLGEDGTLWGSETFVGQPGQWQRIASLRPFRLPGADAASREPWRVARALLWEAGWIHSEEQSELVILKQAWDKQINCPQCHSMGRLFDAAAALIGICSQASYESQAAMMLEAMCCDDNDVVPLPLYLHQGYWLIDWEPLLSVLQDQALMRCQRAAIFHNSLVEMALQQVQMFCQQYGDRAIGVCGGVFQNRRLSEMLINRLRQAGFRAYYPKKIPINDAGLAFGQIIEANAHDAR
ncbi:MAG: carbamoyltransferase HypF [Gammaproteobacteria bacterium]|nr:carbamoyltransferase HypF [Gammaproteobacteria bacterium]